MPFTDTWDAAFESVPADNEDINLGANRIRALKVAVRERMQVDHEWEDGQEDGKHNKVTLVPQASAPVTAAGFGFLYTQTIAGCVELLYKDSAGSIMQLTEGGALFPFATGDFSIAADLAVGNNATFGETVSFSTDTIAGFAAFATGAGNAVLQFSSVNGGTYFEYVQATGDLQLVVGGAVVQTWP